VWPALVSTRSPRRILRDALFEWLEAQELAAPAVRALLDEQTWLAKEVAGMADLPIRSAILPRRSSHSVVNQLADPRGMKGGLCAYEPRQQLMDERHAVARIAVAQAHILRTLS